MLSVVVGLGLLGMLSAGFARLMAGTLRSQRTIELRDEVLEVRNLVRQIDCRETLAAASCDGVTPIALLGSQSAGLQTLGTPSSEPGAFLIGRIPVRAFCGQDGIRVESPRILGNGEFARDGDRGYVWKNLFEPDQTRLCRKGAIPEAMTPRGMCIIKNQPIRIPDSPRNVSHFRTASLTCPPQFPVAVSAQVIPACNADSWQAFMVNDPSGVPHEGHCAMLFFWDNPHLSPAERGGRDAHCRSIAHDSRQGSCQVICCNL